MGTPVEWPRPWVSPPVGAVGCSEILAPLGAGGMGEIVETFMPSCWNWSRAKRSPSASGEADSHP
jgi:hypothetical protein